MDLTELLKYPVRLAVVGVAALMIVIFGVQDAQRGSATINPSDLLMVFGMYMVPFLLFVFMIWSGRWSELKGLASPLPRRERIGLAADITRVISPTLYLLTLPFWGVLASYEPLAVIWHLTGVLSSIVAFACTIAGSPRRWLHAILSILMLPCWLLIAGLLAKTLMD